MAALNPFLYANDPKGRMENFSFLNYNLPLIVIHNKVRVILMKGRTGSRQKNSRGSLPEEIMKEIQPVGLSIKGRKSPAPINNEMRWEDSLQ